MLIPLYFQLPDGRRLSAFRSVWRRIYLHDEYAESSLRIRYVADTRNLAG